MRLLLVEDDEPLAETISTALTQQHYVVDVAVDGEEGWDYTQAFTYDLIVLDVKLPKLDGISLCRRLRQAGYNESILLLTVQGGSADKVTGLDAGADDYVVKPCSLQELLARIRALLRRRTGVGTPLLEWGTLCLNPSSCEVTYKGQFLPLSPKEYSLLELFLRNRDRVLSRSAILEHLWSFEDPPGEDTVRAHIKGLRRKLKIAGAEDVIETVYGMGYRLKPLSDSDPSKQQLLATVNQTWERFQTPILERLNTLEQAIAALQSGTLTEELRQKAEQNAHKLAGSLGMFGFAQGSRLAKDIEQWLADAAHSSNESIEAQLMASVPSSEFESSEQSVPNDTLDLTPDKPQRLNPISKLQNLKSMVTLLYQELQQPLKSKKESQFVGGVLNPTLKAVTTEKGQQNPLLLVVDDDVELTEQLSSEALNWGIRITVALDITQARSIIAKETPDIVLLDLNFPDAKSEGLVLLEELTTQFPDLPVLVFTVCNEFSDRVAVARLGGRAFLSKPVAPVQVLEAVRDVWKRTRHLDAKILAVDDDPILLKILERTLQPWGVRLTTVSDPRQFWQTLETTAPDLLMLDVEMPHFDGIELCQVVRNDRTWNGLPILFLTSHQDAETIHRIYQAGADDYICKPVTPPELLTRVFNRLERSRLLRSLSEIDQLTGVINRPQSTKQLNQYLHLSQRYNQPLSLAVLDLDHFKQVNNEYGHAIGDRVLQRLGQILRQNFRSEDVIARWGGQQFVIGMYGMNKEDGVRRLNEVLQIVRQEFFPVARHAPLRVTFSAGVAQYLENGTDLQSLYRAADTALIEAKAAGRNRIFSAN